MTKGEFTDALVRKLAEKFPLKTQAECRRLADAVWRQYVMHGFTE
jgi:hypothetical protein